MNTQNSILPARLLRCGSTLVLSLFVSTSFAQAPEEVLQQLKPATLPVRAVHRDPNAVAPSCPVPETPVVNAVPETPASFPNAPFVYPGSMGARPTGTGGGLPDKRVRTLASSRASSSTPNAVSLLSALITGITPSDCTPPAAKIQFAATDQGNIYSFVSVDGGSVGDAVRWEWYAPDGSLSTTNNLTVQFNGASCFWAWIPVSDDAKKPGNWSVKIFYQNALLRTLNFTVGQGRAGGCSSVPGKVCRDEISTFYQGAHSLGTAFLRPFFEDTFPGPLAIAQIQASLDNLVSGMTAVPCISFDLTKITSLKAAVPTLSSATIIDRIRTLISDIQLATRTAALPCDGGANFESLYVVGVNLGAAIGQAIGFMYRDPLSPDAISFITASLTNASAAMANYVPCSNNFTPPLLAPGNFDLANPQVLVPLTQLIGTYNLIVWNISLSCCCCTCSGSATPPPPTTGNATITGVVRNAATGAVLSGATVAVTNTTLTTKTGNDGSYTLANVPAGARTLQASLQGFVTSNVNVTVTAGQTVTQNISLSPVLQSGGEIRITLNWSRNGGVPDDLDMHLFAPKGDGSCSEVYYVEQGSLNNSPFAFLEADNIRVDGDPPLETIHISKLVPGTYSLYIHHYSSFDEPASAMPASRATVQAFTQAGTVFSQTVPSGTGIFWDVLRINGTTGAITATNTLSSQPPSISCR